MQTVVDRVVLLQQVSDYAVQQLLAQMQARLEHLENTVAAMVAAASDEQLLKIDGVSEKALRQIRGKLK